MKVVAKPFGVYHNPRIQHKRTRRKHRRDFPALRVIGVLLYRLPIGLSARQTPSGLLHSPKCLYLRERDTGQSFRLVTGYSRSVVVPLISPNSNAVVAGHPVFRVRADQLFPLTAEFRKVIGTGPELLPLCKIERVYTVIPVTHMEQPLHDRPCDIFQCGGPSVSRM